MLIDRSNFSHHRPWLVSCLAVTVLACLWFAAAAWGQSSFPSGSSWPGFTFGVLGGLICVFEFLLWPRKKLVRHWRLGRTVVWMRAHIWLGLLAVPLLVLHTGFRWGGPLSMTLMILFLVVVASGVWGLVFQQFVPRMMLQEIPAETIHSQIDYVSTQLADEARQLVTATCGVEAGEEAQANGAPRAAAPRVLVVGKQRSAGGVQGKVLTTAVAAQPVPNSEALRLFFREAVEPYLRAGPRSDSPLKLATRAGVVFRDLRTRIPAAAHDAVASLEDMCEQRRQLDRQARLHFWLHSWLCVHLPLSAALILLLVVHVFVALKYW